MRSGVLGGIGQADNFPSPVQVPHPSRSQIPQNTNCVTPTVMRHGIGAGTRDLCRLEVPGLRKAQLRSRRRRLGEAAGPRGRIAVAYAEWRDWATDYGFGRPSDTPLAYLGRFVPDNEHRQLAWLVTRTLWGDLRAGCTDEQAQLAEELSRGLRRRLAAAQPTSLRLIAIISRLSVRSPYLGEIGDLVAQANPNDVAKEVTREDVLVD